MSEDYNSVKKDYATLVIVAFILICLVCIGVAVSIELLKLFALFKYVIS